ncbi:L-threonylcarbamoyladenylate synthase [Flavilitoribacter nigricans]|uniref:Threonylcarbamoyl-AMP synthase n=1 Tax=Flavilitoribacter nigricans (strain ATCC 23147 / DSM 23189 / NBRC 102662 / NCIMB 1420 / SS-2) TaxID=1122177 RepID=A0A2D0NGN8_FLAN2|nr:L-threonylcarbamoyladenylate synthase [Flavilitoribacter nigricans]PHN07550.1 threonylcarbamoyl-AMP synthase [Flavilitoribacter nigricans DSM 23189 = NBRC 102662]
MIGKDLDYAAQLLTAEEIVAIPTETVYGLAGNALSTKAVTKIFAVKNRPAFDPLIIHTNAVSRLAAWTESLPDPLRELADRFMPGPLTLLVPKLPVIPDLVTAGSPRVAVRIPRHPLSLALLERLSFPLAAPSANPFGYISPTTAQHVEQQLGEKINYILDGGPCTVGLESTIVGMEQDQITVFRKGGLAVETIEAVVGPVRVKEHSSSNPQAPGMLKSHYAPRVPLRLGVLGELQNGQSKERLGILAFRAGLPGVPAEQQIILSQAGDLQEAAQGLFAAMRRLDQMDIDLILAEPFPETGLGRAINDRLRRASAEE